MAKYIQNLWTDLSIEYYHSCLHHFRWFLYLLTYLVQIYSIIYQAGSHFTKNLGKAAFDLINLALIAFAIYVISAHSTLVKEYFFEVMVGLGFVMARTISTALVCSVS